MGFHGGGGDGVGGGHLCDGRRRVLVYAENETENHAARRRSRRLKRSATTGVEPTSRARVPTTGRPGPGPRRGRGCRRMPAYWGPMSRRWHRPREAGRALSGCTDRGRVVARDRPTRAGVEHGSGHHGGVEHARDGSRVAPRGRRGVADVTLKKANVHTMPTIAIRGVCFMSLETSSTWRSSRCLARPGGGVLGASRPADVADTAGGRRLGWSLLQATPQGTP
jgi:hypothetical protein